MKALVKLEAKKGVWLQDMPEPTCGPRDIKIKIKKTAICGTDVHIYLWDEWAQRTIKTPHIFGHEYIGTVVEVGSTVTGFSVGDRVSGEGHITCGNCRNCRGGTQHLCPNTKGVGVNISGAFAEYLVIPAENAIHIPPEVSDDIASILDPFGNATHSALSFDLVGEDVLITGAGPVGLMATALARKVGARHIVVSDPNEYRLEMAQKLGASMVLNPFETTIESAMKDLGMTEGFDVGLEMSGNPNAFKNMLKVVRCGAKVVLLGLLPSHTQIDWDDVIFKGLFLKGIYGREMYGTWYKMISLLQGGFKLDDVITHHYKLKDYQEAFDVMSSGNSGKVIIDWQ